MAEERENRKQAEFLGGGPKFNTVGKDVRGKGEPPLVTPRSGGGRWIAPILAVALALAVLYALSAYSPGRVVVPGGRGGRDAAQPAPPNTPTDPNLK